MSISIFSWSTRNIRSKRPQDIQCFDCHDTASMSVNSYVKTFEFFFIPVFPFSMWQEVSCAHCNATLSYQEMGPELREKYKPYRKRVLPRPWHFAGPLIILGLFLWTQRDTSISTDELLIRAESIKVNRMITIQLDEKNISSLKVIAVKEKSIQVVQNQQDTLSMSRDSLIQWVQSEKVTNIYWPR